MPVAPALSVGRGDVDPEGVRQRAAERMADTARAAARLGVDVVIGLTARRSA